MFYIFRSPLLYLLLAYLVLSDLGYRPTSIIIIHNKNHLKIFICRKQMSR